MLRKTYRYYRTAWFNCKIWKRFDYIWWSYLLEDFVSEGGRKTALRRDFSKNAKLGFYDFEFIHTVGQKKSTHSFKKLRNMESSTVSVFKQSICSREKKMTLVKHYFDNFILVNLVYIVDYCTFSHANRKPNWVHSLRQ